MSKQWIYQHKQWPNFTWDDAHLSPILSELRYKQGKLQSDVTHLGLDLKNDASLNILTSDIVKSSAIEGEILNPLEVRSSIARRLGIQTGGLIPSSRSVESIVEIMLDATQKYNQPLTIDRMFAWHNTLFPTGYSGMHKIDVGCWRTDQHGPMQVISGPMGRETVHYEAMPADVVNKEMQLFLSWFENNDIEQHLIDPLLKSGIAHFWFVTIHPFDDGNGRVARALADMLLTRADNTPNRYYSMSTQIASEREEYYNQLMRQQRGNLELTNWLEWYLACMNRALDNSEHILKNVYYKNSVWHKLNQCALNDRQRKIISRMLDNFEGHMNTSKYAKLAKCSTDSALRDIQSLSNFGLLIKNPGGGRSTSYRLVGLEEL